MVHLNALGSHSHASNPEPGRILEYKWAWKDPRNVHAINGMVTVHHAQTQPRFPLSTTEVTLEIHDQFCNKAAEKTFVTVNPSFTLGAYCYYYNFWYSEPATVPISS